MLQMETPLPPAAGHAQRNASLDTLRGLAILFVLFGHFTKYAPYVVAGLPLETWFTDFGHGGVILFFMLSGYLIWTKGQENPAPVFLLRRFAKIVPAYWANVLFVAAMGLLVWFFPAFALKDSVGNLLFLGGSMGISPLSGVYWTLIVEVKFYLLFALVFYTPLKRLFWLVPLAAVTLNLILFFTMQRTSTLLIYLPIFFIGAAIAAVERRKLTFLVVVALAAVSMAGLGLAAPHRGWQAAVFLAADLALFWALYRNQIEQRHLAWLGVISYSVYLYHTTLGFPLLEAFGPSFGALWPVWMALVLVLVALVSWLSYHHIEVRFVQLARRLEGPREKPVDGVKIRV
jgi:peptidoglycan/LPS O-acetylase OafA/YrhL